mmetsp:Transcript_40516/g.86284  ORF Transcript_40516/g.86284 Transcript_40516/m.86284 type:complete len:200 (+) Transcript_40516:155-754(+)
MILRLRYITLLNFLPPLNCTLSEKSFFDLYRRNHRNTISLVGRSQYVLHQGCFCIPMFFVPLHEATRSIVICYKHVKVDHMDRLYCRYDFQRQRPHITTAIVGFHVHINDGCDRRGERWRIDVVCFPYCYVDLWRRWTPSICEAKSSNFLFPLPRFFVVSLQQSTPASRTKDRGQSISLQFAMQPQDICSHFDFQPVQP